MEFVEDTWTEAGVKFWKPFKDVYACACKAHNWFKAGLHEDTYEVGLKLELEDLGYDIKEQQEFNVWYKGQITKKKFRMDLCVCDENVGNIVLELKALQTVGEKELRQLHNYMRLTNTKYGMLINFGNKVYSEIWRYDEQTNKCYRMRY